MIQLVFNCQLLNYPSLLVWRGVRRRVWAERSRPSFCGCGCGWRWSGGWMRAMGSVGASASAAGSWCLCWSLIVSEIDKSMHSWTIGMFSLSFILFWHRVNFIWLGWSKTWPQIAWKCKKHEKYSYLIKEKYMKKLYFSDFSLIIFISLHLKFDSWKRHDKLFFFNLKFKIIVNVDS